MTSRLVSTALLLVLTHITIGQFPPPRPFGLLPLEKQEVAEINRICGFDVPGRGKRDIHAQDVTLRDKSERLLPVESRVLEGDPASSRDFPAQVLLQFTKIGPNADANLCGGTLITRRHVITAAHCFLNLQPTFHTVDNAGRRLWELHVFAGPGTCYADGDACVTQQHRTDRMTLVRWNRVFYPIRLELKTDLAIVQLSTSVRFDSAYVERIACLLPFAQNFFVATPVHVAGWGRWERARDPHTGTPYRGPFQPNWQSPVSAILRRGRMMANRSLFTDGYDQCTTPAVLCAKPFGDYSRWQMTTPGDSGGGMYIKPPDHVVNMPRLVAVISGIHFTRNNSWQRVNSWVTVNVDLTNRYLELCYFLHLCVPPGTPENTAAPEAWERGNRSFLNWVPYYNEQALGYPVG